MPSIIAVLEQTDRQTTLVAAAFCLYELAPEIAVPWLQAAANEVSVSNKIAHHWWTELAEGHLIDFRARMWLGDDARVPHGLFRPKRGQRFERAGTASIDDPFVFHVLAGIPLDKYPQFRQATDAVR